MTETTTRPELAAITEQEKKDGKIMAVLAYLGILVFIPILAARNNKFAMFHAEQGLALFVTWVIVFIAFRFIDPIFNNMINMYFCGGSIIYLVVRLFLFVLAIMGIINAAQGNVKEIPVIGSFGSKFNLVK